MSTMKEVGQKHFAKYLS